MAKVLNHPLIEIKLTKMRDEKSDHSIFRQNLNEIASLMVYEIMREYQPKNKEIFTSTGSKMIGKEFDREIVIVPILRAGLGMVQGITNLIPEAKIGHIGMYRDEVTFEAVPYFFKMPDVDKSAPIIIVDPMLATGVSSDDAINQIKKAGFDNISLVCLVGAPEGVEVIEQKHPDVEIFLASLDEKLNEKKYIIPGLGDAGDRLFGTK